MVKKGTLTWDSRGLVATDPDTGVVYDLTKGINRKPVAKFICDILPLSLTINQLLKNAGIKRDSYSWFHVIVESGEDLIEEDQIKAIGSVLGVSDWDILTRALTPSTYSSPLEITIPEAQKQLEVKPVKSYTVPQAVVPSAPTKLVVPELPTPAVVTTKSPKVIPVADQVLPVKKAEQQPPVISVIDDSSDTVKPAVLKPEVDIAVIESAEQDDLSHVSWDSSGTIATYQGEMFDLNDRHLRDLLVNRIRFLKGFMPYSEVTQRAQLKFRNTSWLASLNGVKRTEIEAIAKVCDVSVGTLLSGDEITALSSSEPASSWLARYEVESHNGKAVIRLATELYEQLQGFHPGVANQVMQFLQEKLGERE